MFTHPSQVLDKEQGNFIEKFRQKDAAQFKDMETPLDYMMWFFDLEQRKEQLARFALYKEQGAHKKTRDKLIKLSKELSELKRSLK